MLWLWTCGAEVSRYALSSMSRQKTGGQQQHGPASIWQLAEVMAIVQRAREATRSSAFTCEPWAADSPRPLAFISNLSFLSAGLVQGWPKLQLKGDFLQYSGPLCLSCACGNPHRELRGIDHRGRFATQVAPLFPVVFWSSVLEGTGKALRDGVSIQNRSDQENRDGAKAMSDYSSSPWFTMLSRSPDSHMGSFDNFVASSLSNRPFRRKFIAYGFRVGWSCYVYFFWNGCCQAHGWRQWSSAGWCVSRLVVVAGTGKGTAVVDVGDASDVCDDGAVHARGYLLVLGFATGVSLQSLASGCHASMGRPGFRSLAALSSVRTGV